MSMNKNDSKISNYFSTNKEKISVPKTFSQKSKEQEEPINNEGPKKSLNNNLFTIFNSNNPNIINQEKDKIVQKKINNINNNNQISVLHSSKKKIKIFNILRKNKKKGKKTREDDITQTIIRHFINFFFYFVNFYIKTKIKEKRIRLSKVINFKIIYYKDKDTIKIKDILKFNIENLLLFKPKKKDTINNKNDNKNDNNKSNNKNDNKSDEKNGNEKKIGNKEKKSYIYLNEEQFREIKNNINISLDNFFERPLIDLFIDIYSKKRKEIDLTKYEIKSKLPKNIETFEELKKRNKDKEAIMDKIIKKKIINTQRIKFKTYKKK